MLKSIFLSFHGTFRTFSFLLSNKIVNTPTSAMAKEEMTRKEFFKRLTLLSTSVSGSVLFLSACGSPGRKRTDHLEEMPDSARYNSSEMTNINETRPEACNNITELTANQKSVRSAQQFTVNTPFKKRYCSNCLYFKAPDSRSGSPCGSCTIVPGPIDPGGYCKSWKSEFKS